MAIKYDSDVNDKVSTMLNDIAGTLNTGLTNSLLNDFDPFLQVNLFSNQLNNLKSSLDKHAKSYENLSSLVASNKSGWDNVEQEAKAKINSLDALFNSSASNNSYTSSDAGSSFYESSKYTSTVDQGKSVKDEDVAKFINQLDDEISVALVKKLDKLKGESDTVSLLTDSSNSGILLLKLKKLLGDNNTTSIENTEQSSAIQRLILIKLNRQNNNLDTEEGMDYIKGVILENINNSTVDESVFDKAIYGDNTETISALGDEWVVAKTKYDVLAYEEYIKNNGVKQDSDTAKYGDYCLAFSYVHAYDLYTGIEENAQAAGNYAHAAEFEDYVSDSKEKVLSKIYDEIMKGKPVVLQVNGNKEGTVRHFVTVVGFKSGVASAENLKESDLLIVDSWDGKVERMDTSSSRFMTTGKACNKEYSGYRLRVLKDSVAA